MTDRAAERSDTTRGLLLALLLIAALVAMVAWRYRPPAPAPADISTERFSAVRAIAALTEVLGDQTPHPVGSAANRAVRDRIVAQLRALGYEPEIQRGYTCEEWADCGFAENIVARLPGREPGSAVALTAHYDSVGAGPGASDDGAGVASLLEIARALRVQPPARHDILLLVTDGEEVGLFGARVFIDEHPLAASVRAAVNLEARGTSGPSFLFETGSANAWAMKLFDGLTPKPITNSIYYMAYKLLPNDTDSTVFKTRDWQGYNFAFTGSVQQYHTPLDDLAHLSAGSVQHHGDNALASLLQLANAGFPQAASARDEAVYLDVFAAGLLRWPAAAAVPAAIASALLLVMAMGVFIRRRWVTLRATVWGLVAIVGALLLGTAASYGLQIALRMLGALPPQTAGYQWTAEPAAYVAANCAVAMTLLALLSSFMARRAGFWGLWTAAGVLLNLAGVASAVLLPGLSFALLLPGAAMTAGALPALLSTGDRGAVRAFAAILPCGLSVMAWLPTLWFVYQTLGLYLMPVAAFVAIWMLTMLMPLLAGASATARRAALAMVLLSTALASGIAWTQPVYTAAAPQRMNFEYWLDADSGRTEWLARPDSGQIPAALLKAAPFVLRQEPLLPWTRNGVWTAEAPKLDLQAPGFEVLASEPAASGKMRYRARLWSPRGAPMASVCFTPEAGLTAVTIGGYLLPAESPQVRQAVKSRRAGWHCLADHTLSVTGVEMQFEVDSGKVVDLILSDRNSGLPASGKSLLEARPIDYVRSQDGDVTRVVRRLRLP